MQAQRPDPGRRSTARNYLSHTAVQSVLEELQKKQRLLELEEKERLLVNIPPEIIEKYNKNYKEETALEV